MEAWWVEMLDVEIGWSSIGGAAPSARELVLKITNREPPRFGPSARDIGMLLHSAKPFYSAPCLEEIFSFLYETSWIQKCVRSHEQCYDKVSVTRFEERQHFKI
jgi:hypothetical protein